MFRDRTVLFLFLSIVGFHLANAPILPVAALYVKKLGGSGSLTTATVLTAQIVMIPIALAAGRLCDWWGRKPMMAIAFLVLPLRILSYAFVNSAAAVVAIAADLTRGKGHFNTLMGLLATAVAIGGVAGPLISGALLQYLGFHITFYAFALLAAIAAGIFLISVPETGALEGKPSAPWTRHFLKTHTSTQAV